MRRVSPKRRALIAAHREAREAYLMTFPVCQICDRAAAVEIHEIVRGGSRRLAYGQRAAWLSLCRNCHEIAGDYGKLPLPGAYGFKGIRDPAFYDRVALNRLRGRADEAVSEADVLISLWEWRGK